MFFIFNFQILWIFFINDSAIEQNSTALNFFAPTKSLSKFIFITSCTTKKRSHSLDYLTARIAYYSDYGYGQAASLSFKYQLCFPRRHYTPIQPLHKNKTMHRWSNFIRSRDCGVPSNCRSFGSVTRVKLVTFYFFELIKQCNLLARSVALPTLYVIQTLPHSLEIRKVIQITESTGEYRILALGHNRNKKHSYYFHHTRSCQWMASFWLEKIPLFN